MFRKEYKFIIHAVDAIDIANKLANKRLWFNIGPGYLDCTDDERRWLRQVRVKATKGELVEIFGLDEVVCGCFVD